MTSEKCKTLNKVKSEVYFCVPLAMAMMLVRQRPCRLLRLITYFITYQEQHSKGHIYRAISHVCHTKSVCPLGNNVIGCRKSPNFFIGCRESTFHFVTSRNNIRIAPPLKS